VKNGAKDTIFERNRLLRLRGELHDLSSPWVMGILNLTPDSFYDGGRHNELIPAIKQTENMLIDGARIIDIGASSSRPGAKALSSQEEIDRLRPFLKLAKTEFPEAIFSVDTYQSEVARAAADHGADIINDISGGTLDSKMPETMGELGLAYIMMHMRGTPANMKVKAQYTNVFKEVTWELSQQLEKFRRQGVHDVIIDPGFGFAKNLEQNYELFQKLPQLQMFGLPILVGVSRKSMITRLLEIDSEEALNGTTVLNTLALVKGADILRVHDVREAVEATKILTFIENFS
jgi:dihydropteroate synthase